MNERVADFLRDPRAYGDAAQAVDVEETHASWVFLTGQDAYKLKKGVRYEFLDFSTAELRRRACEEEVRINRRLAPQVYLGVMPIRQTPSGRLTLAGAGETVDWLVHMRRLPRERAVDALVRAGRLSEAGIAQIADLLVEFYRRLPPAPVTPDDYHAALVRHVRGNGEVLLAASALDADAARRLQSAHLRYLHVAAPALRQRVAAGRVVDGHGDLRPEHIYLTDPPVVIDGVEFSADLRQIDVADELSFLSMECRRLGDERLGQAVLRRYQQTLGDPLPPSLLAFYHSYRAAVRAKVAVLRGRQATARAAGDVAATSRQYLDLAYDYARSLGPPLAVIVGGLMGSGKTTLADALGSVWDVETLSTDRIRHDLLGPSRQPAEYGEGRYQPVQRQLVYERLIEAADDRLARGLSVILDGAFLRRELRERAYAVAAARGAKSLYVRCDCPRDVARARIERRRRLPGQASEARPELAELQLQEWEDAASEEPLLAVDATRSVDVLLEEAAAAARAVLFDPLSHGGDGGLDAQTRGRE